MFLHAARSLALVVLFLLLALASHAKEPAKRAGLDPARLARVDAAVQGYIDAKQIPGAVSRDFETAVYQAIAD